MEKWLEWAIEIQSLAQIGLTYTDNPYNIERYERLREIANEKNTKKQIEMCFKAANDDNWQTIFD